MLDQLRDRLDQAILLARYANLDHALDQAVAYREALTSPVAFALLRHFATELCEFIENRTHLNA